MEVDYAPSLTSFHISQKDQQQKQVISELLHVTHDMSHVTCDM